MMTGSSDLAMERTLAGDLEDGRRDVGTAVGFENHKVGLILHHDGDVVEGEIGAHVRPIEAATRISLDQDRPGRGDRSDHGRVALCGLRRPPGGIAFKIGRFCLRGYRFCAMHSRGAVHATIEHGSSLYGRPYHVRPIDNAWVRRAIENATSDE